MKERGDSAAFRLARPRQQPCAYSQDEPRDPAGRSARPRYQSGKYTVKRAAPTESAIARYETGENRIAFEMLFRLMEVLGITPLQFFEPPDLPPWWRWLAVR